MPGAFGCHAHPASATWASTDAAAGADDHLLGSGRRSSQREHSRASAGGAGDDREQLPVIVLTEYLTDGLVLFGYPTGEVRRGCRPHRSDVLQELFGKVDAGLELITQRFADQPVEGLVRAQGPLAVRVGAASVPNDGIEEVSVATDGVDP